MEREADSLHILHYPLQHSLSCHLLGSPAPPRGYVLPSSPSTISSFRRRWWWVAGGTVGVQVWSHNDEIYLPSLKSCTYSVQSIITVLRGCGCDQIDLLVPNTRCILCCIYNHIHGNDKSINKIR